MPTGRNHFAFTAVVAPILDKYTDLAYTKNILWFVKQLFLILGIAGITPRNWRLFSGEDISDFDSAKKLDSSKSCTDSLTDLTKKSIVTESPEYPNFLACN